MLERASFIIDPALYPEGFYLVVVEAPEECGLTATEDDFLPSPSPLSFSGNNTVTDGKNRKRDKRRVILKKKDLRIENVAVPEDKLRITIKENSPLSNYLLGTGIVCLGYLFVFIFSMVMVMYFMKIKETETFQNTFTMDNAVKTLEETTRETPINNDDTKEENDNKIEKRKRKTDKTVSEFCRSTNVENPDLDSSVYKKNQLHWVILIVTGMFYYLPTIQMVLNSSNMYKVTGNQDYCFYNSLCQMPLGVLRDFNHIFSNLGYGVLGLIFMWVVYKKESSCKLLNKTKGIPRQYSLFYAMGLSLMGVGVMSSCYHVCPTNVTFQFDTTYMYMLAFFMFLKIYQNRHPDLVCSAFKGFLFLAICLGLEVNK